MWLELSAFFAKKKQQHEERRVKRFIESNICAEIYNNLFVTLLLFYLELPNLVDILNQLQCAMCVPVAFYFYENADTQNSRIFFGRKTRL